MEGNLLEHDYLECWEDNFWKAGYEEVQRLRTESSNLQPAEFLLWLLLI
jgi:hypothetical protein